MDEFVGRYVAIDALTAETLERNLDSVMDDNAHRYSRAAQRVLAGIQAADVRPVRRGKWTLNKDGSGTCSECGRKQSGSYISRKPLTKSLKIKIDLLDWMIGTIFATTVEQT